MSKDEKLEKKAPKKAFTGKKKEYTLAHPYKTSKKDYKRGEKIMLTEEGRAYLKSIHKI